MLTWKRNPQKKKYYVFSSKDIAIKYFNVQFVFFQWI